MFVNLLLSPLNKECDSSFEQILIPLTNCQNMFCVWLTLNIKQCLQRSGQFQVSIKCYYTISLLLLHGGYSVVLCFHTNLKPHHQWMIRIWLVPSWLEIIEQCKYSVSVITIPICKKISNVNSYLVSLISGKISIGMFSKLHTIVLHSN